MTGLPKDSKGAHAVVVGDLWILNYIRTSYDATGRMPRWVDVADHFNLRSVDLAKLAVRRLIREGYLRVVDTAVDGRTRKVVTFHDGPLALASAPVPAAVAR